MCVQPNFMLSAGERAGWWESAGEGWGVESWKPQKCCCSSITQKQDGVPGASCLEGLAVALRAQTRDPASVNTVNNNQGRLPCQPWASTFMCACAHVCPTRVNTHTLCMHDTHIHICMSSVLAQAHTFTHIHSHTEWGVEKKFAGLVSKYREKKIKGRKRKKEKEKMCVLIIFVKCFSKNWPHV